MLNLVNKGIASGIPFDGPEESRDTPELRQLLRRAAADAIVLLKNDKQLLPIVNRPKSIAVIGPNAKYARTSGGGSARLTSTYTVSPLEGILGAAQEIGADVKWALGTTTHKYIPLLHQYLVHDGKQGANIDFWNELPSQDFISTSADLSTSLPPPVWSTTTKSSECFLVDGVVSASSWRSGRRY